MKKDNNRMTIFEAAVIMGCSEQFLRDGLKNNQFPFGYAIKNKKRNTYFISRKKFLDYNGLKEKAW